MATLHISGAVRRPGLQHTTHVLLSLIWASSVAQASPAVAELGFRDVGSSLPTSRDGSSTLLPLKAAGPNYERYEEFPPQDVEKEVRFARDMDQLMRHTSNTTVAHFTENTKNMGPTMMQCSRVGGGGFRTFYKRAFGNWPTTAPRGGDGDEKHRGNFEPEHVGVAMRSISKVILSAGFLALSERVRQEQDRGRDDTTAPLLSLTSTAGEFLEACRGTSLEHASVSELLSLSAGLDDRLNAHWKTHMRDKADHVGFPSYCDVKGLAPIQCVEQVICPAYSLVDAQEDAPELDVDLDPGKYWEGPPEWPEQDEMIEDDDQRGECRDVKEIEYEDYELPPYWGAPDMSCHEIDSLACARKAEKGQCFSKHLGLLRECPLACGLCCCPDRDKTSGDAPSESCIEDRRNPVPRYFKVRDQAAAERRRDADCTYDNYSYTVLDAMVTKASGRQLWEWTIDLIARPLGMADIIRCMTAHRRPTATSPEEDGFSDKIPGCFTPPLLEDMYDVERWPLWRGGPESLSWPGIQLLGSTEDFSRFMAMILGGGTVAGVKIISKESANEIFLTRIRYPYGQCMGMDAVGLGIGKCESKDMSSKGSLCKVGGWWGWGGSYGSRFMMFPESGVACVTLANMPTASKTSKATLRFAARQHFFAHRQAELTRETWPQVGSA